VEARGDAARLHARAQRARHAIELELLAFMYDEFIMGFEACLDQDWLSNRTGDLLLSSASELGVFLLL
jgi:hypothetical protein